jgi:hypothetical protein
MNVSGIEGERSVFSPLDLEASKKKDRVEVLHAVLSALVFSSISCISHM